MTGIFLGVNSSLKFVKLYILIGTFLRAGRHPIQGLGMRVEGALVQETIILIYAFRLILVSGLFLFSERQRFLLLNKGSNGRGCIKA